MKVPHFSDTGTAIRFCDHYRALGKGVDTITRIFADLEKYWMDERWNASLPAFGQEGASPVRVPAAGTHEVSKASIRALRNKIYDATPTGYDKPLREVVSSGQAIPNKVGLDAWLGRELEAHFKESSPRDKSNPAFWRTVAVLVIPELVFWRWRGYDYFSGEEHSRIYPRQAYGQWVMIGNSTVTTSAVQAILERPKAFVDPVVSRKFAKYLMDQQIGDSDAKKIGKAYLAESLLCCLELLDDGELLGKFEGMRSSMGIFVDEAGSADADADGNV